MANARQMGQTLATRREAAENGAVATQAPEEDSLPTRVKKMIEAQSTAFKAVLPAHVDTDRFARLVLTAVKAAPDLMACFGTTEGQTSVLLAAMQAAAVGLEPNTPTGDCWLLPRRRKIGNDYVWECQLRISYRGWMKLARRSGTVRSIDADAVHKADHFVWKRSFDGDVLEHEPYDGEGDPGPITHAYARVFFTNGGYAYVVLNRRQLNKRRAMSDSWKNERARAYSPWETWEEEMCRKSAILALRPYLDLSSDIARTLEADEQPLRFNDSAGVIEAVPFAGELGTGAADEGAQPEGQQADEPAAGGQQAAGDDDPGRPFDGE